MSDLLTLTTTATGGGIFGLVGTALGRVAGFLEQRQSMKHEQAKWAHETELLQFQAAAARQADEADQALADVSGSWAGLRASMKAEAGIRPSYHWVDAVRGLTRPTLTLLLWMIAASIWIGSDATVRSSVVDAVTFAATAATLWWFGDRAPKRR